MKITRSLNIKRQFWPQAKTLNAIIPN